MSEQEIVELISCAINATMTCRIRITGRARYRTLYGLVKQGYLIPLKERDNPAFDPNPLAGLNANTTLTLTEKGKAWILALNPADFERITWFPRVQDVTDAQKRLGA